MTKFLILGAGPAGLSFAHQLILNGEDNFIILESEKEAGGLCRSLNNVYGSAIDIGGGHILDVKRPEVLNFLFKFMPRDEWNFFKRNTAIYIHEKFISHPFEANIWQFDIENQISYLKSIAQAGCNTGKLKPEKFTEWIKWKLGEKIADDYMLPYNQKMFGKNLNNIGTYWLEKLPSVSFEDTLRSCLEKKAHAIQPGHAEFFYPIEHGYGELWLRMARQLNGKIKYNQKVIAIDFISNSVRTNDGNEYNAQKIINTVPWNEFQELKGMPKNLINLIKELKHTSVEIKFFPQNINAKFQWIYYPQSNLTYHRIFVRHNVLLGSSGYWTETNLERVDNQNSDKFSFVNKYAYPLNTVNKPLIMQELLNWCSEHNVYAVGRWGEHQHYNSDLTVEVAIKLANKLIK